MIAPTLLGHVGAVSGSAISIRQFEGVASGISIIGGRSYRVGQVGKHDNWSREALIVKELRELHLSLRF